MQLVKIEKKFCPACDSVSEFLADQGLKKDKDYARYDIQDAGEDGDKAREILGNLGYFTVPVTVVMDGGEVKAHSLGFKPDELEKLVELVK